ncbi:TPA: filamentous hemagglutinin N-terminal domain-containing protein [Burkholderia territorii]|uniref:two-partner secretion domain-containing protein n=1 Tax=Burkholderia territorii TaxID=1503055 RepID=UPI0011CAE68C|nr:filamentous hemagglutinin N-terminal domain-containing protein [Burkholderia territorii]TXG04379.1 filamentous hemagglutinin N-terminal domain-containing protein [Burkholderia territorii]HDR8860841.1 filamentous hemagglutinin N-terminal domain-containing protein [Burkholderia territorii]HDR8866976.1 filamentous hemagglutinin N-terminal domain-containing protein [Burkholderia territorii]HDR8873306.1 filamentous hemagglutinin N-terminal domain-containing protein [Burkholderia territorii]HDR88
MPPQGKCKRLHHSDSKAKFLITRRSTLNKQPASRSFALRPIVLATSLLAAQQAFAVGDRVVMDGSGSIVTNGAITTVNQKTDKMVIYWGDMNVAAHETLNFEQPSKTAAVLNRVIGADPTQILGALNASGRVFIVNPNGILIGSQAKVNVGSLVASSLNMSDDDFLAGRLNFSGDTHAKVVNEGRIDAKESVALIGPRVENSGSIHSRSGSVALAAADGVSLSFAGNGLQVKLTRGSLQALVENGGMIVSANGDVMLTAWARDALTRAVVNQTGKIEAGGMGQLRGIRIASEGSGTVTAGGDMRISGGVRNGPERSIEVSAQGIRIADGARFDAAGERDSIKLHTRPQAGAAGYVAFGEATLKADHVHIIADNVLSAATSAGLPTFAAGAVMLKAHDANTGYVLNRAPDAEAMSTLLGGTGSISRGFLKAAGEQNLWVLSHGDVSAHGAVNANALSIAGNANVDLSGGFDGKQLGVWGKSIKLAGTTQADSVSLSGQNVTLDGAVHASHLKAHGYAAVRTTDRATLQADEVSLSGGQIDFSRGAHTLQRVDLDAKSASLSLAGDTTIGYAKSRGDLTVRSQGTLMADALEAYGNMDVAARGDATIEYAKSRGDLIVNSEGKLDASTLEARGDLTVHSQGKLVANTIEARGNVDVVARGDASFGDVKGNRITLASTDGHATYERVDAASHASIEGARGIDGGQTYASSLTLASDGDVRFGNDLLMRGPIDISGRNITAARVRAYDTRDLSARARIVSSKDVRVAATGNVELGNVSGHSVALAADGQLDAVSVAAKYDATLDGKGGVNVRDVEATFGDLTLTSDGRIRFSGPLNSTGMVSLRGGEILADRASKPYDPLILGWAGVAVHGVHSVDLFAVHSGGGDVRVTSDGDIRFTADLWAHGGTNTVQGKSVTAVSKWNDRHRPGIYATGDVSVSADTAPTLGAVYSRTGAVRVTYPAPSAWRRAAGDA